MNLKSQCGWNYFLEKWNSSLFPNFWQSKFVMSRLYRLVTTFYRFLPLRSFIWIISISSNYLNDANCDFYSPWNIIFDQDSSKTLYYENQSVCSITWLCASKSWHFKVYSISHGRTESSIGSFGRHVLIDVLNWKNRIIPSKYYSYH